MVASDTVVGLVGAGILLVALVGVFVYESQAGGASTATIVKESRSAMAKGLATVTREDGVRPMMTGQCQPVPPDPSCTDASTKVQLTVSNLSLVNAAHYVLFLRGSQGNPTNLGGLTLQGMDYTFAEKTVPGRMQTTLVLSLEGDPQAATPSLELKTWTLNVPPAPMAPAAPGSPTTPAATPLDGEIVVDLLGAKVGNFTLDFSAAGSSTSVNATVVGFPARANFVYVGWMVRAASDGNTTYAWVGNLTGSAPGQLLDGYISGSVAGTQASYDSFIITLDPKNTWSKTSAAGPVVASAKL